MAGCDFHAWAAQAYRSGELAVLDRLDQVDRGGIISRSALLALDHLGQPGLDP